MNQQKLKFAFLWGAASALRKDFLRLVAAATHAHTEKTCNIIIWTLSASRLAAAGAPRTHDLCNERMMQAMSCTVIATYAQHFKGLIRRVTGRLT